MMVNHVEDARIGGYTDNMKNIIIKSPSPLGRGSGGGEEANKLWQQQIKATHVGQFLDVNVTDSEAFKLFGSII
jgi:hypothetical protein